MHILVVEDHPALQQLLSSHLRLCGFDVDIAANGHDALKALTDHSFDALILDLGLPDMDGMQVLKQSSRLKTPCLILTARDALSSRIRALNSGADDYVIKPFEVVELEARLRAVLRRANTVDMHKLIRGNVTYEPEFRFIQIAGKVLDLPRRESMLLEEMLRVAPRILIKDRLEEHLYPSGEAVTLNAIEALVSRLRRKLADMGATIKIDTVRGIGYRIIDQVVTDV
ncbi:response regulator transcription factor [Allopusillimonas ginsengisoli]|uniref:response regulator transcription factor n=1 Tax=Allopusillimonas ginsengisoli TaxID=453575 RepID=UPI0039C27ED0